MVQLSLDRWGAVNQGTTNKLSGTDTCGTVLVNEDSGKNNGDVDFVPGATSSVQKNQNETNTTLELGNGRAVSSSLLPLVVPSTSTHVAESCISEENTDVSVRPVGANFSGLSVETRNSSLDKNGLCQNQEVTLDEGTNISEGKPRQSEIREMGFSSSSEGKRRCKGVSFEEAFAEEAVPDKGISVTEDAVPGDETPTVMETEVCEIFNSRLRTS